jgi:hypothetical protein
LENLASEYVDQEESELPWVQFASVPADPIQTPKRSRTTSPGSSISSGRSSEAMSTMRDRRDVLNVDVTSLSQVIRAQLVFFVEKLKKIENVTDQEQLLDEAVDLVKKIEKTKIAK